MRRHRIDAQPIPNDAQISSLHERIRRVIWPGRADDDARWPERRDTINTVAVETTTELLATAGPARLDGVRVIGVDEHRWAHTRHAAGDGYVTVIVDLTGVVEQTGRARLLDLVEGRSAAALTGWLAERTPAFRAQIEIVAMDGFGGYKNAATSAVPDAVTVWTRFPCRRLGRGEVGPVPPTRPAGHDRSPRPGR